MIKKVSGVKLKLFVPLPVFFHISIATLSLYRKSDNPKCVVHLSEGQTLPLERRPPVDNTRVEMYVSRIYDV